MQMRKASEVEDGFPYGRPNRVCYMEYGRASGVTQLKYADEQNDAVARACKGQTVIYAVWPGKWSSDLFWIDKPELLAEAIKLKV